MGDIQSITVLGAGTMGHGIAHVAALSGYAVQLFDLDQGALDKGLAHINKAMQKGVDKGKLEPEAMQEALSRLQVSNDFDIATASADLVIEAVPENLELKSKIFAQLDAALSAEVILASNTSSISLTKIAQACKHPERCIGMHFFNPPHILKLLEIVQAEQTSPQVLEAVRQVGEKMHRHIVVVKDSPGFASSRLGLALGLEAIRMLEQGVASAEDIDRAMEKGYNHPMGPLKLTDLVGLDVRLGIAETLYKELDAPHFAPPQLLKDMVAAGKLGKKSGEGFYRW